MITVIVSHCGTSNTQSYKGVMGGLYSLFSCNNITFTYQLVYSVFNIMQRVTIATTGPINMLQ